MDTLDFALLILRLGVGLTFAAHGAQKVFGWWGGPGFENWQGAMAHMGFRPARVFASVSAGVELVGGLLLAVGFLTPLAGAALIGQSVVIIGQVHWQNGFFNTGGGIEFPLTLGVATAAIVLVGQASGALTPFLASRWSRRRGWGSCCSALPAERSRSRSRGWQPAGHQGAARPPVTPDPAFGRARIIEPGGSLRARPDSMRPRTISALVHLARARDAVVSRSAVRRIQSVVTTIEAIAMPATTSRAKHRFADEARALAAAARIATLGRRRRGGVGGGHEPGRDAVDERPEESHAGPGEPAARRTAPAPASRRRRAAAGRLPPARIRIASSGSSVVRISGRPRPAVIAAAPSVAADDRDAEDDRRARPTRPAR